MCTGVFCPHLAYMDFAEFLESEIASIKIGKNIGSLNNFSATTPFPLII